MAKKNVVVTDTRQLQTAESVKAELLKLHNKITKKKGTLAPVIIDLREIEFFSGIGLTQYEIADYYGIEPETFTRLKHKDQTISQAVTVGKRKDLVTSLTRLQVLIDSDDLRTAFQALKFKLNTRHGRIEGRVEVELPSEDKEQMVKKIEEVMFG